MLRCHSTRTAGGFRWTWTSLVRHNSSTTSSFKETPRLNPVGIQYLSKNLDKQVFPTKKAAENDPLKDRLTEISQKYLDHHGLLGKRTTITEPLNLKIPELEGNNLDEHFRRLALYASGPYLDNALELAQSDLPPPPKQFVFRSGWWKYTLAGTDPVQVDYPDDCALVFDVETQYKVSNFAVMAVAASKDAWYTWVSPKLTGESDSYDHLIPMNTLKHEKVIVGHNVGYDRARLKEEYDLKETKAFFLDTMSLHIAVSGMCSRQRIRWMEHRKLENDEETSDDEIQEFEMSDPWVKSSSPNSLAEVAQFYCKQDVDKSIRSSFDTLDIEDIRGDFHKLMKYCANDVLTTHRVYRSVLPEFLEMSPHPVSFAALRFMGAGILPSNHEWDEYIERAENLYQESRQKIENSLCELAETAAKLKDSPDVFQNDPWWSQLDWTVKPQKITKKGELYKNQKLPGFPEWYKDLWISKENRLDITIRARITPILLKLRWEGYPVVWHDLYGWCFKAHSSDFDRLKEKNYIHLPNFEETLGKKKLTKAQIKKAEKDGHLEKIKEHEELLELAEKEKETDLFFDDLPEDVYFRVPNNTGPTHRTTLLLAKQFSRAFEKGLLNSDNPIAQEALSMNASCSYWISARERIKSQFVVKKKNSDVAFIIPQVVTMGTVTRRAVEKTWLTASNAKKSRIGSELKSKIIAPKGYCFVGADVDSEELWIASLVGDSLFKIHGSTAIGWMTLEGSKAEGTDLHSKTANILGISRNESKIFNYGRIYGAGVKFASSLLRQFNPSLSDTECSERAHALYAETKGQAGYYYIHGKSRKLWYGGSESVLFNELERIAHQEHPRTPVLGASITRALMKKNLNTNSFLPSRVNWAIQSSGVDYLHLLCVSMNYLIKKYSISARLSLSVHDEIRYLVKEEDKYRAAMALQISNIWTRAIFAENLGMKDLPQACAFFSAVDIDRILRKEVDMDCITPSNPIAVPKGESLDINGLIANPDSNLGKARRLFLRKKITLEKPTVEEAAQDEDFKYSLDNPVWKETYLKMQTASTQKEFKALFSAYNRQTKSRRVSSKSSTPKNEPVRKGNGKNISRDRSAGLSSEDVAEFLLAEGAIESLGPSKLQKSNATKKKTTSKGTAKKSRAISTVKAGSKKTSASMPSLDDISDVTSFEDVFDFSTLNSQLQDASSFVDIDMRAFTKDGKRRKKLPGPQLGYDEPSIDNFFGSPAESPKTRPVKAM